MFLFRLVYMFNVEIKYFLRKVKCKTFTIYDVDCILIVGFFQMKTKSRGVCSSQISTRVPSER
jgi:hypothetical protein